MATRDYVGLTTATIRAQDLPIHIHSYSKNILICSYYFFFSFLDARAVNYSRAPYLRSKFIVEIGVYERYVK